MKTTPTGIPYIDCEKCGINHPETRDHCRRCNAPSITVSTQFPICLKCGPYRTTDEVTR